MTRRKFAYLCAAGSTLRAQDDATFKTGIKVVNVLAVIRTKKGEIIRSLGKDDFTILEDGKPQTIQYFAQQSDLPLTLGIMVDTSMSQGKVLDKERAASFRFLDQVLRDGKDQVFIMQFDVSIQVRQPLTSSFAKLNDALSYIDLPTREVLSVPTTRGTVLYDAVVKASQDVLKNQQGRKALILLTDGVDIGSDATLDDAIAAAQRADTVVYSILYSDSGYYGMFEGPGGAHALRKIAGETGGRFFEVSKKLTVEQVYAVIEDELRSQYSLGYVTNVPVRISEFRNIQLQLKEKGLQVQARDRYWAQR